MNVKGVIQGPTHDWVIHASVALTIIIIHPKMDAHHSSVFFVMFISLDGMVLFQKFGTSSLVSIQCSIYKTQPDLLQ